MVHLACEIRNERLQSAALLAPAEIIKGMRYPDRVLKVSAELSTG
jgi:hypothetical protein